MSMFNANISYTPNTQNSDSPSNSPSNSPYNSSSPLNNVNTQPDMFQTYEDKQKQDKLKEIQEIVNGCHNVTSKLARAIEENAKKKEEGSTERCINLTALSFRNLAARIEKFEKNPNFMSNEKFDFIPKIKVINSSSIMPDGATCKKKDVKPILDEQIIQFETLLEDLIKLPGKNFVLENSQNFEEVDKEISTDYKIMKIRINHANNSFVNIEKQTRKVLGRFTLTKLYEGKNAFDNTLLYKEILSKYNKIAQIKSQFGAYLSFLAVNVEFIRPVISLTKKIVAETKNLQNFNTSIDNVEKKGYLNYTSVLKDKEDLFKENFNSVSTEFCKNTVEAIALKKLVNLFLDKGILLNEQYSRDLAYGVKKQLDINAKSFSEANSKIMNVQKEMLSNITKTWNEITKVQNDLHSKLLQSKYTIENSKSNEDDQMYFVSETRAAMNVSAIGLLNPNLQVQEEELLVKLESKLEGLKELK